MDKITLKTIPVSEAVGTVLFHDITRIEPGVCKGPAFRKGHIIREEDIPVLLEIGKENLYVGEILPGLLHENEAALRISQAIAGGNLEQSEVKEGRINFRASCRGLLRVDVPALTRINSLGDISLATLHTMQEVHKGQDVAGTRIIPLMIDEKKIASLESMLNGPVLEVLPFSRLRVGMVTTGSEVYYGRIKDSFGPVIRSKFEELGCEVIGQAFSDDSMTMTRQAILDHVAAGAEMVVCTGGMSVDPDDRTPAAIRSTGAEVVTYGAPAFPGAMFLLAYLDGIPVLGLPGCVMFSKTTIFDLIVPRILAGIRVSPEDIAALGHGGFCSGCPECRYPVCPFGKY
ncbi:MAG: molybdopterin-binding protein [Mailhella sp.]|nr:molybdopterin-binding protein [Mailhella sp.]